LSFLSVLRKVYKEIGREHNIVFAVDLETQLKYLKTMREPKDDFESSFNQYKCQQFLLPWWERLLKNLAASFLLPVYLLTFNIKNRPTTVKDPFDAVFVQNGMNKNIIPKSLQDKYSSIKVVSFTEGMALGQDEMKLLFKCIKRYPLSPYFHFKIMLKIATYCGQIRETHPKAIISYSETSFSSAIVTAYCEMQGIEHINVMHGDFLKRITFSYFRFTAFYVWDGHYVDLFKSLGNNSTKYFVEVPPSLKDACRRPDSGEEYPYFLTYYLGNEDEPTLEKIQSALNYFSQNGFKCKVRIHPRESDMKLVQKIFNKYKVEYPQYVTLEDSLNQTNYVCALCSTVLYQAWFCGKKIIIDDYSNPNHFHMLGKLGYMLLDKNPKLLSDLL
jgi:hypothetical protein